MHHLSGELQCVSTIPVNNLHPAEVMVRDRDQTDYGILLLAPLSVGMIAWRKVSQAGLEDRLQRSGTETAQSRIIKSKSQSYSIKVDWNNDYASLFWRYGKILSILYYIGMTSKAVGNIDNTLIFSAGDMSLRILSIQFVSSKSNYG